ncbi:hypothetical protein VNO78_20820 [Psophocarpus tetragonolobus]|uniref:Uncharacterized protein n=1 Tax=Psophocarpus tetragonolobus TaxID=3891 RepID=A0AAN9S9Z1_PSOTE
MESEVKVRKRTGRVHRREENVPGCGRAQVLSLGFKLLHPNSLTSLSHDRSKSKLSFWGYDLCLISLLHQLSSISSDDPLELTKSIALLYFNI